MMGKVLYALASLSHCKTQAFFSMPIFLSLKMPITIVLKEMLIIKRQDNLSTKSIFYYLADAVMNINHRNLQIVEA